ncbi:MAG: hypothetical protein U9N86_02965 [Bacteroidota bacterium]|nr:hypothetical protein [Bacteroidota bacterium]
MKVKVYIFATVLFLQIGCEENPHMVVGSPSFPVVYAIFDRYSEINEVYVTRSFSGIEGPLNTAQNFDSVYFENVTAQITLLGAKGLFDTILTQQVNHDRNPGNLCFPHYKVLTLNRDIEDCDYCTIKVYIPGHDTLIYGIDLLKKPNFIYPKLPGTQMTMLPDQPLFITWNTYIWNDVSISFEIISVFESGIDTTLMTYKRIGINNDNSSENSFKIHYERFQYLCEHFLTNDTELDYRIIGDIDIEISISDGTFRSYMEQMLHEQDYMTFHESTDGIVKGVVTSKATDSLNGLRFDLQTKEFIYYDPDMAKYKFSRW